MSIDIVIPFLYEGRQRDGRELRFALRSIEKYLKGYRNIWIIGDPPLWIDQDKVKWGSVKDSPYPRNKEKNIFDKLMWVCNNEEISEDFLMYHDDHMLLKNYQAPEFPYYYHRTLYEGMLCNKGTYRATLNHSKTLLESRDKGILDFDCHAPIVYNKRKFISTFEGVSWIDWGYAIKSTYCNHNEIEGIKTTDCKVLSNKIKHIQKLTEGREWFSTGTMNPDMQIFLAGLYPRTSNFEK